MAQTSNAVAIAKSVRRAPQSPSVLAVARGSREDGWGRDVVAALVQLEREEGASSSEALTRTMALLEQVMDADETIGGWFMAQLYELAGREFLYEVCEAIDLWLQAKGNADLAERLREGSRLLGDLEMARKYDEWATYIEAK